MSEDARYLLRIFGFAGGITLYLFIARGLFIAVLPPGAAYAHYPWWRYAIGIYFGVMMLASIIAILYILVKFMAFLVWADEQEREQ